MKVLHINTTDIEGGAARAAYRLHHALLNKGVDSTYFVQRKLSSDPTIEGYQGRVAHFKFKWRRFFNRRHTHRYKKNPNVYFSYNDLSGIDIKEVQRKLRPDIVHLHWIGGSFLNIEDISRFSKRYVWTLHDMWPLTGGCHYSDGCQFYHQTCHLCPAINSFEYDDLSSHQFKQKRNLWKKLDFQLIAPSQWMKEQAQSSSLFRGSPVEVIANGLDLETFSPQQEGKRSEFGLPEKKKLILFGAVGALRDYRKGFQFLKSALRHLRPEQKEEVELVIFGSREQSAERDQGIMTHYLGAIHDDKKLAKVYSLVDAMVVPSIQESFGQTASEALACGTPVVAFQATGLQDIVNHKINGYLAQPYDVYDLKKGILWVLEQKGSLKKASRTKACEHFGLNSLAERHLEVYQDFLKRK